MDDVHVRVPADDWMHINVQYGSGSSVPIAGLTEIRRLSSADYAAMTKDSNTLYIVQYSDHIELYLGTLPLRDSAAIHGDGTITDLVAVSEMPQSPDAHTLYVEEASS